MTTVSLLIALASPVVAVVIAVWSLRRTSRSDRLRAFFEIQERYLDADVRLGRRLLHREVAGRESDAMAQLSGEAASRIGYALAVMNSIAIACEGKYVDTELVALSMGRSYAGAIEAAKPYIDYVERQRGFRPYPFAERLAVQLRTSV
ncbi:hypothetical protein [Streptomyces sp. AK04-3B]|uniref:DUF4760 domain-containing protein n=1 Tax=Streptomyces sp. AK04-3B TaxID=3028650 RepID=UPI0029B41F6C|nr:hypothetical protein [Streptomyces sp. AK04-3B]MDX3798045.1 hypothetical protein [Streptomyces sp. AK04-3B]